MIEPPAVATAQPLPSWADKLFLETMNFTPAAREQNQCERARRRLAPAAARGIIGESAGWREVLRLVAIVAPMDATVLILGETGTGKELIAEAIHRQSSRRDKLLVKVNCAAMPGGLLESEFFGHERGAFTGAIARKAGRFELAHQGTLFLDEIGDIPLELQPKLLRVLQEQEFERVGGTVTTRVDTRIVVATSRDLPAMVRDRQFRSDLFYRLNVFPIQVPALRERREDIPLLVEHFVAEFSQRMNKRIDTIPLEVMQALGAHAWPGNVRELQNFIERAVILSAGRELRLPACEWSAAGAVAPVSSPRLAAPARTLKDIEREHILLALRAADWVVGGPTGAARRLGLKRTTLAAKMQKLGIHRPTRRYEPEPLERFEVADGVSGRI
ncbi:MAG TPA: sigma 54-interacting transcriptional regulator [Candidatus Acidoferrales bacterium]|nr:sigma 54-interacting transcriptional regulator [Candidatus Acidoferrales bacterium]